MILLEKGGEILDLLEEHVEVVDPGGVTFIPILIAEHRVILLLHEEAEDLPAAEISLHHAQVVVREAEVVEEGVLETNMHTLILKVNPPAVTTIAVLVQDEGGEEVEDAEEVHGEVVLETEISVLMVVQEKICLGAIVTQTTKTKVVVKMVLIVVPKEMEKRKGG